MKKIFRIAMISVFFLTCGIGSSPAVQELFAPGPGVAISMDFKDASLKDILKILSIQSGMNFIASEAVQDRLVTLYMDKVPLEEAMNQIFSANNLTYVLNKEGSIFLVKDWGKPMVETVTKVFYLKHATVSSSSLKEEMKNNISSTSTTTTTTSTSSTGGKWTTDDDAGITKAVRKLLTPLGSLIEDFRTNSLIVTDIPSRMPVIAQVITALDVSVPQVMLEVEILDVSKNAVDEIGFKFGQTPFSVALTGGTVGVGFPFKSWSKMFSANPAAGTLGTLDINSGNNTSLYTMALDFLRTQTDTKYLARPRILTLNNETAEIKITTNETIGVITTTTGTTPSVVTYSPERAETGVSLRVTPQIDSETGEITMFVMPTVKDSNTSTIPIASGSTTKFKDPEERSTKSTVRVKDGETVIMGGLLRNQRTDVITKLPFLGDIPLLGVLFRHRETSPNKERELLVFITPHIVKDTNKAALVQAKTTLLAQREQDVVSAGDREAVIASNLDKFERKNR